MRYFPVILVKKIENVILVKTLLFLRYSGGQMPLAKKRSHSELVFRKV